MKKWTSPNGMQIVQVLAGRSNSFLVSYQNKFMLIDTGTKKSWNKLSKILDDLIANKGSLVGLLLTHAHFDHVENAASIREKYQTSVFVHESEAGLLASGKNAPLEGAVPLTKFFFNLLNGKQLFERFKFPACGYDITVQEKYDLKDFGLNAYILHTPGHSGGSVSMIIDDEIALTGDAMFGVFKNSVFPPWAADAPLMVKSWKKLLDTGCKLFLPGHGTGNNWELVFAQYQKYEKKRFSIGVEPQQEM